MTDLQFKILNILYKTSEENIEFNRFILIEKLDSIKGLDDKSDIRIKEYIEYINTKNELTKEYLLLRKTLGKEVLGINDDDIILNFEELSKAAFINVIKRNIYSPKEYQYSDVLLTDIGKQVYEKEKNDRELLRTKLEREVSLLESNIKVNGYQYWIKASIVTTAIATIFYVIISYLQLVETRLTKIVEKSELEQKRPIDSLHQFQNGRDHYIISQTKP